MGVGSFDKSLYIVVLGGRAKNVNIELHDVRWVLGSTIEDTFLQLRQEWLGNLYGLHIDSYIKLRYIDGYELMLTSNRKEILVDENKLWL